MTKLEAKELTLEVWRYLAKHPECTKQDLPIELFRKIDDMQNLCPLCELPPSDMCKGKLCPLKNCWDKSSYSKWAWGNTDEDRKQAAQEIVEAVEAWEPEEEG